MTKKQTKKKAPRVSKGRRGTDGRVIEIATGPLACAKYEPGAGRLERRNLPEEAPGLERRAYGVAKPFGIRAESDEDDEAEMPVLIGYASIFGKESDDLGGFIELVAPGAFKRSLASGADVRALVEHDPARIIARRSAGTLDLVEDSVGLLVRIRPANTTAGRDVIESVRRGDLTSMSFSFKTPEGGDRWQLREDGTRVRTLLDVDLYDVAVVCFPAYADSSVALARAERALRPLSEDELDKNMARLRLASATLTLRDRAMGEYH